MFSLTAGHSKRIRLKSRHGTSLPILTITNGNTPDSPSSFIRRIKKTSPKGFELETCIRINSPQIPIESTAHSPIEQIARWSDDNTVLVLAECTMHLSQENTKFCSQIPTMISGDQYNSNKEDRRRGNSRGRERGRGRSQTLEDSSIQVEVEVEVEVEEESHVEVEDKNVYAGGSWDTDSEVFTIQITQNQTNKKLLCIRVNENTHYTQNIAERMLSIESAKKLIPKGILEFDRNNLFEAVNIFVNQYFGNLDPHSLRTAVSLMAIENVHKDGGEYLK